MRLTAARRVMATLVVCLGTGTCTNTSPPPTPPLVPGAIVVRGTERLLWSQPGEVSDLQFHAWVDGRPVLLAGVTCDDAAPEATCAAPLPPLGDGVHTIALSSVLRPFDLESDRSEPLTVQKVSDGSAARSVLSGAISRSGSLPDRAMPRPLGDDTMAIEVVARGVRTPAQLAATPDGRLLVAESDGGVRVVSLGSPDRIVRALDPDDSRGMLRPARVGALGLSVHPAFSENRFVYVAYLTREALESTRLHVVRMREIGNTLGEPATIFEAPVVPRARQGSHEAADADPSGAPLMAFGPDQLLYLALPLEFEFLREPIVSTPDPSMLRIHDDGRMPEGGPLTGVRAHPLGFTWDPLTGALWLALPEGSDAAISALGEESAAPGRPQVAAMPAIALRLPMASSPTDATRALVVAPTSGGTADLLSRALVGLASHPGANAPVRLSVPIVLTDQAGRPVERISDVAPGGAGAWYLVASGPQPPTPEGADGRGVVVRVQLGMSR